MESAASRKKQHFSIKNPGHDKALVASFCKMLETETMIDLVIKCGEQAFRVHKLILVMSSGYFREKLHENPTTGQIVINGLSFPVLKALIEYMYCGEATVLKDQYKQLIGAAAFFQIIGLEIIKDGSQVSGGSIDRPVPPPPVPVEKPKLSKPNVNIKPKPHYTFKIVEPKPKVVKKPAGRGRQERVPKFNLIAPKVPPHIAKQFSTKPTTTKQMPVVTKRNIPHVKSLIKKGPAVVVEPIKPLPTVVPEPILHKAEKPNTVELLFENKDGKLTKVTDEVLQKMAKNPLQYRLVDERGKISEVQDLQMRRGSVSKLNTKKNLAVKYDLPSNVNKNEPLDTKPKSFKIISLDDDVAKTPVVKPTDSGTTSSLLTETIDIDDLLPGIGDIPTHLYDFDPDCDIDIGPCDDDGFSIFQEKPNVNPQNQSSKIEEVARDMPNLDFCFDDKPSTSKQAVNSNPQNQYGFTDVAPDMPPLTPYFNKPSSSNEKAKVDDKPQNESEEDMAFDLPDLKFLLDDMPFTPDDVNNNPDQPTNPDIPANPDLIFDMPDLCSILDDLMEIELAAFSNNTANETGGTGKKSNDNK